jgi:hypothetical protein
MADTTQGKDVARTVRILRQVIEDHVAEIIDEGGQLAQDGLDIYALGCDERLIRATCFKRADARTLLENGVLLEIGGSVSLDASLPGQRRHLVALNCAIVPLSAGQARHDRPPAWTLWERSLNAELDEATFRKAAACHEEVAALVMVALAERFILREEYEWAVKCYCIACDKLVAAGAQQPEATLHRLHTYVKAAARRAWNTASSRLTASMIRPGAPESTRMDPCGCGGE